MIFEKWNLKKPGFDRAFFMEGTTMDRRSLFTRFFSLLGLIAAGFAGQTLTGMDAQGMPETPVTDRKWRLATHDEILEAGYVVVGWRGDSVLWGLHVGGHTMGCVYDHELQRHIEAGDGHIEWVLSNSSYNLKDFFKKV